MSLDGILICVCLILQPIISQIGGHLYNKFLWAPPDFLKKQAEEYAAAAKDYRIKRDEYERALASLPHKSTNQVTN